MEFARGLEDGRVPPVGGFTGEVLYGGNARENPEIVAPRRFHRRGVEHIGIDNLWGRGLDLFLDHFQRPDEPVFKIRVAALKHRNN